MTSPPIAIACPPAALIRVTVSAAVSSVRSATAKRAPSRAIVSAVARPMPEAPPVTSATLRSRIPAISCFLLPCEKGAGRFDGVSPAVFGRAQNTLRARDALANRDRSSSQSSLAHPREIRTPGSSHCELCLRLFIFQTVPKGRSTKLWREMPSPGQLCRRTVISGTVASFEKLHFVGRFSAFSTTTKPGRSGGWRREWDFFREPIQCKKPL